MATRTMATPSPLARLAKYTQRPILSPAYVALLRMRAMGLHAPLCTCAQCL